jgi:LacI family transcriptional regulator
MKRVVNNALPQVVLLIEASRGFGRQIIRGVARYAAEHGPWSLRLEPRNLDDSPPQWLKSSAGDGIIVRVDSPQMADAVMQTGVPVIDVRGGVPEAGLPLVGVDNDSVVDAAIEHFRERGLHHFAWCDFFGSRRVWVDVRRERFCRIAKEIGVSCSVFDSKRSSRRRATWTNRDIDDLIVWLTGLPRPVAILARDDEQAHLVLDAAQHLDLRIPDDAVVLGIDNDEVFCQVTKPPLSSVDVNAVSIGYKAAEALHRLMRGQKVAARTMVPSRGVVTRQSTDIIAVADPEASAALRFIREHACRPVSADEVADHLAVSRSTLDRMLRLAIGQTATAAIMQVRLSKVKAELADTDLSLAAIAGRTGFASVQHMANLFRDRFGVTPGSYRRDIRH